MTALSARWARGFTLVEVMVTVAIVAVLASVAVPSYKGFLINQEVSSASSSFMFSLMQARSEAMRQGAVVAVLPADGSEWGSGWYLSVLNNSCEKVGDSFGIAPALSALVAINKSNSSNSFVHSKPSFTYGVSGFPFSCPSSSGFVTGSMNGKLAFYSAETARERQVVVSLSGRARVCDPSKESNCK